MKLRENKNAAWDVDKAQRVTSTASNRGLRINFATMRWITTQKFSQARKKCRFSHHILWDRFQSILTHNAGKTIYQAKVQPSEPHAGGNELSKCTSLSGWQRSPEKLDNVMILSGYIMSTTFLQLPCCISPESKSTAINCSILHEA